MRPSDGGALREPLVGFLVGLLVRREMPITVSTGAASRREWRTARRALRLGLAELADDDGQPPRDIVAGGLRLVRLTARGREYLGIPEPALLGGREPLDVLREAVSLLMGEDGFTLTACPPDWTGPPTMIAFANHHLLDGWDDRLDAVAVVATGQGVACRAVALHDGRVWVLAGFETTVDETEGARP